MANGPLGGFMPTPPSPGQPPQVKLETSAESRGAFNKFLGTLPRNGAVAPIQTGVVPSSTAPVSPVTSNVNIFQPQMSQMAPMPMMPPAQPVQMMQEGGDVSFVDDDPVAGFDFNEDTGSFDIGDSVPADTGSNLADEQQQNISEAKDFFDSPISAPVVDTRPRTNISNVGPTSNLRFDPQFTADLLSRQFGDSNIAGFMSKDDFAQTTQGGATAPTLTSVLPSFGTGTDFLRERELAKLRPSNVNQIAPVTTTVGTGATTRPNELDLLGLGGLGVDLSSPQSRDVLDNQFTQLASLRGGIDRLISPPRVQSGPPSITTIEDDLIQGRGLGENINNPGNIRSGGGFDGEIGRTRDGFAIFDTMQSGVDAINKLSNTYGSKRNINTVREFANRYSPVGENTAKEVAGKINLLSNALGVGPDDKVDFTDPNVQAKLTPAIITSEIGADRAQNVANVLRGFDPKPLDDANVATEPFTSFDVARPVNLGIAPIGEQRRGSRGDIITASTPSIPVVPQDMRDIIAQDENLARIEREQEAIQNRGGRPTFAGQFGVNPVTGQRLPGVDIRGPLAARLASVLPDQALETLEGRRDRLPDQVFDIETITPEDDRLTTVSPDALARIGREQRIDDANTFRQTVPDAAKIFGGRQVTTTPRGTDQELSPIVAAGIGAPEEFKQPFPDAGIKIGNFTIPTLTSGLNLISDFSRQRVFDAVLNKGATPVYDGDVLVGAKINGVLVEGMDPNAPMDSGDNQDPITKFLKKATEDKEEDEKDEKPPNVIGGGVTTPVPEPKKPTVVKSTAPASTASFTPVGFNAGNLNDLIARITGVPTPRRMQEGGTVAAVDRFLSKVA